VPSISNEIKQDIITPKEVVINSIPNKPKRELPKSSKLGAIYKDIHQEVVIEKDDNKIELHEGNLQELWSNFLEENRNDLQNAFLNVAQTQVPVLIENKITFTVTNNVSLEMLQLHKMDITTYFRKKTTSNLVVPDFQLKKNESQLKNYKTAKDRLKDMIDDNNAVLKLIEKFELNMD
jgi:hypothetical protein